MNITESGARLQEYIEESKEKKEMIEKEIREEKDKEIERLKDENAVLSDECIRDTKEIARLKKKNNDLVLANKGRKALAGAQFSCMERLEKEKERLKKEKEWLITQLLTVPTVRKEGVTQNMVAKWIQKGLQQSLKEK